MDHLAGRSRPQVGAAELFTALHVILAKCRTVTGQYELSRAELTEASANPALRGRHRSRLRSMLAVLVGDRSVAVDLCERAEALPLRREIPRRAAVALHCRGLLDADPARRWRRWASAAGTTWPALWPRGRRR